MIIKVKGMQPITASSFAAFTSSTADAQVMTMTTVAGNAVPPGSSFYAFAANDATVYCVWFNVDSSDSPPKVPGVTLVEVAVTSATDTAVDVADAIETALNAAASGDLTVSSGVTAERTITCDDDGGARGIQDGEIATGFTFVQTTMGNITTTGLTNLYKIEGTIVNPGTYTDGNMVKEFYFSKRPVEMIVHGCNIEYIAESHS